MLCKKNSSAVETALKEHNLSMDFLIKIGHLQLICIQTIKVSLDIKLTGAYDSYVIPKKTKDTNDKHETTEQVVRSGGDLTEQMMKELGFKVGDIITPTKKSSDECIFKIASMGAGVIKMQLKDDPHQKVPDSDLASFQRKKWRHVAGSKNETWSTYKEPYAQHDTSAAIINYVKALATVATYTAWDHGTLESDGLNVAISVRECVVANRGWQVGALVLAPNTQNIQLKESKAAERVSAYSPAGLPLGHMKINGTSYLLIASSVHTKLKDDNLRNSSETLMVPFWNVETTDEEGKANMKLSLDTSKVSIKPDAPEVSIPLMKNFESIKTGDHLVLFVKAAYEPSASIKRQKTM